MWVQKDFSPEVVAVLQSLATPAGQPSQGRPEGMGEGGHLQGRSSANSVRPSLSSCLCQQMHTCHLSTDMVQEGTDPQSLLTCLSE